MYRDHHKQQSDLYDEDYPLTGEDSIFNWLPEVNRQSLILHNEPIRIVSDILQRKYFEAFNFYFSKPINEILANLGLPHVILYKDYLYYDDESEYLKRYYQLEEVPPRLKNLSKFYSSTSEGMSKPNLAVHEQNKIILKRNNKLHKYYLNKLENFAEIPQTQRNHKVKEDFKILNNLHDEDGYSEDLYRHQQHQAQKKEVEHEKVYENERSGGGHNSFQQMLEKYENATAKLSFDSNQHNVYEPDYSSESPNKIGNRSTEENISFEKSIEFYAKGLNKEFPLFEKQGFTDTRTSERMEEKTHIGHGDTEDQIPHNVSDFGLSDASEINLINEMMKTFKEDRLSEKVPPARAGKEIETHGEKPRVISKQKENEIIEKEKEKHKAIAVQKVNALKSKSTSTNQVLVKHSENASARTAKTSIDKPRTPREVDLQNQNSHDGHPDKVLKSLERNIAKDNYMEKPGVHGSTTSRKSKEEIGIEKGHSSARNIDAFQKLSPRDLQHTVATVKNVHINQIKHTENSKEPADSKANGVPFDDKALNKTRKSAPQTGKKIPGTYKKLSMPGDSKATTEKLVAAPAGSVQYIKGLVEKFHKHSDEGVLSSKAKGVSEKGKDNSAATKSKINFDDIMEKFQRMGDIYSSNDLYTKVAQKAEPKSKHQLSRSKTEDALLKDMAQNKSGKVSKESPTKIFDTQPSSAKRMILSPTNPRKDKVIHRFGSNEGLSPRLIASSTNKLTTQLSLEKSLPENLAEEKPLTSSGNYKSLKVEKMFAYKRTEMKPPMKSGLMKNEANNSNTSNTRRLTAAHTGSGASSVEKNDIISMPVSPTKKFDLKLNLNKLNQLPGRYQNDMAVENSYGFWSSRSAKIATDDESKHLRQSGGMTEDRSKFDSSKKEYLLKKNYEPYLETKKKGKSIKKGGSFTNPAGVSHGLKHKESETSTKNPTLLKSTAHETDLHQINIQDLNDLNSVGRLRNSESHLEAQLSNKSERRRPSKK